jgi:hypothetical protein
MKALSAAAALAILLLGLFLLADVALVPLLAGDADGPEEAIRRYEAIVSQRDSLRQALAALPPAPAESTGRLPQTTDALALAELQSRLAALAAETKVAVTSAEPMPAEEGGDPARVQLTLDLAGPLAGIQALLYRVETGKTVLAVTRLDLSARPDRSLAARLTIAAWRSES